MVLIVNLRNIHESVMGFQMHGCTHRDSHNLWKRTLTAATCVAGMCVYACRLLAGMHAPRIPHRVSKQPTGKDESVWRGSHPAPNAHVLAQDSALPGSVAAAAKGIELLLFAASLGLTKGRQ